MHQIPKLLSVLFLVGNCAFADNLPTVNQIYETAKVGNLNGAHHMVEQVIQAHPDSAKAHYVDAEILVRQGDVVHAKSEFEKAEKLAPGLPFAKPQSVQNLQQRLGDSSNVIADKAVPQTAQANEKSMPWVMLILGLISIIFVWLVIKSIFARKAMMYPASGYNSNGESYSQGYPNNGPFNTSPGFGGAQPYPSQSGGIGSGIASGLATGAAAGIGIVAGEELMHHFMDGSSSSGTRMDNQPFMNDAVQYPDDMGGNDFGLSDSASWDNDSVSDDSW